MFATLKGSIRKRVLLVLVVALGGQACSNFQPPDANGPRSTARPYPVNVIDEETKDEGELAWKNLAPLYGVGAQMQPQFNPLTGTISALPVSAAPQIVLPKVGAGPTQTEEETRESLRRFINDWKELIGTDPAQLSLVERVDEPSGIKLARYEQHPFRYPLRGGFGNLSIRFRSDRHVVGLVSNCIPNSDRLQAGLAQLLPKISAEDATVHVKGHPITLRDSSGSQQTFTLAAETPVEVRQLVVYALPAANQQTLELHLAWEIGVPNGTIKTIYLDAITDEVIAGS